MTQQTLTEKFNAFISDVFPHQPLGKWLIAVSGGMDSVVLTHLCQARGIAFAIAHCNFQLRGNESLRDQQIVESLAAHLGIPIYVKQFDTLDYKAEKGVSIQVAARELRYQWFQETAQTNGFDFIVTAHHANDNAETVLMNMFRGTGIKGLRGILPRQGSLLRPLLQATRTEIEQYAAAEHLTWGEDSSNADDKYTRNYLRHHIFTLMQHAFPEAEQNFDHTMRHLREAELLYDQALEGHKKRLMEKKGGEIHLPVLKLKKCSPLTTILFEILLPFGFSSHQMGDAIRLMDGETGSFLQSATHRLIKNRNWLIIAPLADGAARHLLIESFEDTISFDHGTISLQLSVLPPAITAEKTTALLDSNTLRLPLLLRSWKPGDYLYPLGMAKKKKVARVLIDKKLSKTDKEKIWVIESAGHIVWIAGVCIDDRHKVTANTKSTLRISLQNA